MDGRSAPLTPEQCRAARALLGWSQAHLARTAGVGQSTVKDYEAGRRQRLTRQNHLAVVHALEAAGIEFIPEDGGGVGVRLKKASGAS